MQGHAADLCGTTLAPGPIRLSTIHAVLMLVKERQAHTHAVFIPHHHSVSLAPYEQVFVVKPVSG